ncbi:MAG TPA: pyruvate dehydrogenase complex dihydrolipoamide acetyltransferase [Saprospiraceae bacterium]|nr:pyruvate dehydrogenase complex dihydrolipoamide acetyltransferase [Saprospiraceae bacterium]
MAEIIRMPRLSDTMEEGNIVSWLKKEGDAVAPGDILAEVETDKATMELESYFSGTLIYIGVPSGMVPVDGIIAIIGDKSDDVNKLLAEAGGQSTAVATTLEAAQPASAPATEVKDENLPSTHAVKSSEMTSQSNDEGSNDARLKASPLAKSLASEAGINISDVQGSGDHGRITKKDIESFIKNPPVATPVKQIEAAPISLATSVQYGDMPVTQMRKVIAKRLAESLFTAPHFFLTMEIDMDNAISARQAMNADGNVKISFNDFVVKACAIALRKHPMINSSWMGDKIVIHENINIGVAVAVSDGLLVPVINHADRKSLSYINGEVKTLAGKAKEKKLQPAEMQGNTFTISNLGMFDIDEFTAIINPPDACILAVGSIAQKPVVKNGQIVVGNIMKVTLSCDHRVVDGATGAQFLQTLKGLLEHPVKMLV